MSDAAASFVPVLAQSSRCGRAPTLKTRCHGGEPSRDRYALYVLLAMAMPSWLRSASGTLSFTAASQRLTKTEATEPTSGLRPTATRRSMPRRKAPAAARYCRSEKRSVTLTGMPAKIASSMAGSPSFVPGILMRRLGRKARACRDLAAAMVLWVSYARSGETSSETQPSTPRVRSQVERNRSAARVTSSSASSKNSSSPDLPSLIFLRMAASYAVLFLIAWSKMVGFEVSPVTDSWSIYRCSVPVFSSSRVMLSSQRLWPWSWSVLVAFIVSPLPGHGTAQAFTSQMSAAYSAMLRSLENFPELATFRIALRAHACGSAYTEQSLRSASR